MNHLLPSLLARRSNGWMFVVSFLLISLFCVLVWLDVLALFRTPIATSASEISYLISLNASVDGTARTGHVLSPVLRAIEGTSTHTNLLSLRFFNLIGVLGILTSLSRLLHRLCGPLLWLIGVVLWFCFPGMQVYLLQDSSSVFAAWFFVLALSLVSPGLRRRDLLAAGCFAAASAVTSGLWLPLVVFLGIGNHVMAPKRSLSFAGGLALGFTLALSIRLWILAGIPSILPIQTYGDPPDSWGMAQDLFVYGFILLASSFLFLWQGSARRGVLWWVLLAAVLVTGTGFATSTDTSGPVLLPFILMACLCLSRIPQLIDLRFPTAYQSVWTVQLLLYLPLALGWTTNTLLPSSTSATDLEVRVRILDTVQHCEGAVLTFVPGLSIEGEPNVLVDLSQVRLGDPVVIHSVAAQIQNGQFELVVIDKSRLLPDAILSQLSEGYKMRNDSGHWALFEKKD